jgi:tetratricopeptide (TPR) repeat protein
VEALQALTKASSASSKHEEVIIFASEGIESLLRSEQCSKNTLGMLYFFRGYGMLHFFLLLTFTALYKQHLFIDSLQDYNNAVAHGFKKSTIYYCRMFNYVKLRQLDKAYEDSLVVLSKKTGKSPNKKFPNAKLGDYLFRQGKYAEAREFFILSHNKNNKVSNILMFLIMFQVIALKRLLDIDYKLDNHKESLQWWKKLCKHCEDTTDQSKRNDFRAIYKTYRHQVKHSHMEMAVEKLENHRVTHCLHHIRRCVLLSINKSKNRGSDVNEVLSDAQLQTLIHRYHIEQMLTNNLSLLTNMAEEKVQVTKSYFFLLMSLANLETNRANSEKYLRKAFSLNRFVQDCARQEEQETPRDMYFHIQPLCNINLT